MPAPPEGGWPHERRWASSKTASRPHERRQEHEQARPGTAHAQKTEQERGNGPNRTLARARTLKERKPSQRWASRAQDNFKGVLSPGWARASLAQRGHRHVSAHARCPGQSHGAVKDNINGHSPGVAAASRSHGQQTVQRSRRNGDRGSNLPAGLAWESRYLHAVRGAPGTGNRAIGAGVWIFLAGAARELYGESLSQEIRAIYARGRFHLATRSDRRPWR